MPYHQSLQIEQRLDAALRLIRTGRYSTSGLAQRLEVSIPTVSRCVHALRDRGYDIRAEKHRGGWRYVIAPKSRPNSRARLRQPAAEVHT